MSTAWSGIPYLLCPGTPSWGHTCHARQLTCAPPGSRQVPLSPASGTLPSGGARARGRAEHTPSRAGAAVRRRAVRASWIAHGVCTSSPGASVTVPQGGFLPISVTDPEPQEAAEAHGARASGQRAELAEFTHGVANAVPGPPATAPPPRRPCPRSTFRDAGRGASRLTERPQRGAQGPWEPAALR